MPGNTAGQRRRCASFSPKSKNNYGQAERVWIMDRGIPTEEVLAEMRAAQPPIHYLVGTPRARVRQTRSQWEAPPLAEGQRHGRSETLPRGRRTLGGGQERRTSGQGNGDAPQENWRPSYGPCRSLRRESSRDRLLLRLGAAKSKAGRAASLVEIPVAHGPERDPEEAKAQSRTGQFQVSPAQGNVEGIRTV